MRRTRSWVAVAVVAALAFLTSCSGPSSGAGGTTVLVTAVGSIPWLASQDGSGAWQTVQTGTSFVVNDSAGRYGVAWECAQASGQPLVAIVQATTAETVDVTASCPPSPTAPADHIVSGQAYNMPTGGQVLVSIGSATATITNSNPSFSLTVPAGDYTFVARGLDASGNPTRMVVQRNMTVSADMNWYPDMSSGTPYTQDTLMLAGIPSGENPRMAADLAASGGAPAEISSATAASLRYPVVPAGLAMSSDRYLLAGLAGIGGPGVLIAQSVVVVAQTPTNGTLTLPSAFSGSNPIQVSGGTATWDWSGVTFSNAAGLGLYLASVVPSSLTAPTWRIVATAGWLGSSRTYTFPNFSATTGWTGSWAFPIGQNATATLVAYQANLTYEQFMAAGLGPFSPVADYGSLPVGTTIELSVGSVIGTF